MYASTYADVQIHSHTTTDPYLAQGRERTVRPTQARGRSDAFRARKLQGYRRGDATQPHTMHVSLRSYSWTALDRQASRLGNRHHRNLLSTFSR